MIKKVFKEGVDFLWGDIVKPIIEITLKDLVLLANTALNVARFPYRGMAQAWRQFSGRHIAVRVGMAAVGALCGLWSLAFSLVAVRSALLRSFFVEMNYILRRASYASILLLRKARVNLDHPSWLARFGWGVVGMISAILGYAADTLRYFCSFLYVLRASLGLFFTACQEALPYICGFKGNYFEPDYVQVSLGSQFKYLLQDKADQQLKTVKALMQPLIVDRDQGFMVHSLGYHACRTTICFSDRDPTEVEFDLHPLHEQWQDFKAQRGLPTYA